MQKKKSIFIIYSQFHIEILEQVHINFWTNHMYNDV
jgi:hypothetical protein